MKNTIKVWVSILFAIALSAALLTGCVVEEPEDGAPAITTTSLPNGTVGTAYNQTLKATGDAPITWSIDSGTLPAGLSLAGSGAISGTPTTEGTFTFTVKAVNDAGEDTKQLSITIAPPPEQDVTTGNTLAEKLQWVYENAQNYQAYAITVSANESLAPQTLTFPGKSNVTIILRGGSSEKTITLSGDGALFNVGDLYPAENNGIKLVLDNNITLKGKNSTNIDSVLVRINSGGTLEMNTGSKLTGNTITGSNAHGAGVNVGGGNLPGTFIMNGGEIFGNTTAGSSSGGAGVYVSGVFIMNGGKISGNTASGTDSEWCGGGGVQVRDNGTFTMNDGEISGNTAARDGGGVYVYLGGTFTMNNGEISGNTVTSGDGGGVSVYGSSTNTNPARSTFTMNGGEISGNTVSKFDGGGVAVARGTFTMNNGQISGNTISNSSTLTPSLGGGVKAGYQGTFTMNGGEIFKNTVTSGEGGGVAVEGTVGVIFRIVNGTIYGSDAAAGLKNTATATDTDGGAALFIGTTVTAERGTFSGVAWVKKGDLDTSEVTIKVVDGELVGYTAPVLSAGSVNRTGDTAATIDFTTDEAGMAYYLVVEKDTAAPTKTAVKAGTTLGAVTAGANSGKAVTLTTGAKDIYVVVEDADGNISEPLKITAAAYAPGDTTAPILSAGSVNRTGDTAATIGFTTDEDGTAYYLVQNLGATAPAKTAVKAGTTLGAVTAGANSGKAVTLTAGVKDIYVVVEDAAGNISEPLKISVMFTAVENSIFVGDDITGIAYSGSTFVAVGSSSKIAYSSDNGVTWTAVGNSTFGTANINGIAYGGGTFVAVGESGKIAYSSNGVTWTAAGDSKFGTSVIRGIAYGNDTFVAVGSSGKTAYSTDNGVTWTAAGDSTFGTNTAISGIAYGSTEGSDIFVAVGGSGKIAYSSDNGVTWTAVTDSTFGTTQNVINSVAYGHGRFVAVGRNGKTAYSTDDGETWTAITNSTFGENEFINGIAYGNGRFVAVGDFGKMTYSTDYGVTWTAIETSTFGTSSNNIYSIAYGNGRFVAGGSSGKMAYCDF